MAGLPRTLGEGGAEQVTEGPSSTHALPRPYKFLEKMEKVTQAGLVNSISSALRGGWEAPH